MALITLSPASDTVLVNAITPVDVVVPAMCRKLVLRELNLDGGTLLAFSVTPTNSSVAVLYQAGQACVLLANYGRIAFQENEVVGQVLLLSGSSTFVVMADME